MKHEFKHRWSGDVLFSSDTAENWRVATEEALRSDANLSGANLRDATLRGADMRAANLRAAKGINKYLTSPLYMLFDQAGPIRSYKLVNAEMEGPFHGGIKYEIGVTVAAEEADTDESRECGAGINVATLDWCLREWRDGYKILLVEHEVSDIACIPIGSDGKYRVHRCRVIAEKDLSQIGISVAAKAEL